MPLDSLSREMRAMVAYVQWLGKDVPHGTTPPGSGLADVPWLNRAANPAVGKTLYSKNCRVCHGTSGEGLRMKSDGPYINPPLWGENSFNSGAGLYRLSTFTKYIRFNMPNGSTYQNPVLSTEEAWDIAAYVVSQSRPDKRFSKDWPDIKLKPVDHPFGPYSDPFSEQQHKYGPFKPIIEFSGK
jgi:thiosulfate dehydrogenase